VRLLLDTHVVLWWRQDNRRLGRAARAAISSAATVYVSAASAWEVAIKSAIGRLHLGDPFDVHVREAGFEPLAITLPTRPSSRGCLHNTPIRSIGCSLRPVSKV